MDFELLRTRWRDSLLEADPDAPDLWRTMNREPERTALWEDLPDPGNVYFRDRVCLASCKRLEAMARWWAVEETPDCFLEDLTAGLEFLYRNWYNERDRKGGEWWHREIGIPLCLTRCIALLYDALEEQTRRDYLRVVESYVCDPKWMCIEDVPEISTGANRVWKCLALAQCGILKQDEEMLSRAADKIRDVFCYTEAGDGFYRDGSFLQHGKFAYTGGYGVSLLESIVTYLDLLQGSPWYLEDRERRMLLEWVGNSYIPLIFRGGFMSMARGREIAREESQEHDIGHKVISALLKLTRGLNREEALPIQKKLKYWIERDTFRDYLQHAPIELRREAQNLLKDETISPEGPEDSCHIFAAMDKVVHHRANFAAAISMCSKRTGRYESIHNENVRGWYLSDGMLYLYTPDLGQFSEDYFPTVNAYRLPGTTVDTRPREETGVGFGQEPMPRTSWAGGVTLEQYGVVGMELEGEGSDLRAKKSWFLFEEEIVCLGAGITATQGRPVETVVENRKIHAPLEQLLRSGEGKEGGWFHLEGPVAGSGIGYFLPGKQSSEISEEVRRGSWWEINRVSCSREEKSNRFVNLLIPHGVNPEKADYAYILLPGKDAAAVQSFAEVPPIRILANDDRAQAVYHGGLNITGFNFWKEATVAGITCRERASVLLREEDKTLTVSLSDPTWEEEIIHLELDRTASGGVRCDPEIRVVQLQPTIKLTVNTVGAMGRSFSTAFETE